MSRVTMQDSYTPSAHRTLTLGLCAVEGGLERLDRRHGPTVVARDVGKTGIADRTGEETLALPRRRMRTSIHPSSAGAAEPEPGFANVRSRSGTVLRAVTTLAHCCLYNFSPP
jgi:hypothetical protein